MKTFTRRLTAGISAAVIACGAFCALPVTAADAAFPLKIEGENLEGADLWTKIYENELPGYSGEGFAYLTNAALSFTVTVPDDGMYSIIVHGAQILNEEGRYQTIEVNGSEYHTTVPYTKEWTDFDFGMVRLNKGENTITVKSYWGYTFLDYLTISDAPAYLTNFEPDAAPCNPNASPEARKLYAYMRENYGNHILSGQQEYCGSHNYNKNAFESQGLPIDYLVDNEAEFEYIQETTGKQPAIRGIDFLFYNTTSPYFDDAPERVIAWYKDKGGIPTVTYHWNVPTEKGSSECAFYVESAANGSAFTTFSAKNAVTEGTWEHEQIDKDIALLAEQLGKARDAGVPILFRPLHEAEGAWFWWGADGPEACKELYIYLWDQLTNKYKLNNLLWIWTASTSAHAAEWYPGDKYVDFQGIDKYNAINNNDPNPSAIAASFYTMVGQTEGKKMVVMSENDTIPSLDNLLKDKAAWLYFCPWYQRYLTGLNDPAELKKIYTSDYCITLDELPDWDTYDPELPENPQPETGTTTTTDSASQGSGEKLLPGDVDCSGAVDVNDVVLLARYLAEDEEAVISTVGKQNGEVDGTPGLTNEDGTQILKFIAKLIPKL